MATIDGAGSAVYALLAATAVLTAIYSTRLVLLTFFGEPRDRQAHAHAHESPAIMTVPLIVLALLAVVGGFFAFDGVGRALGFTGGIGELIFTGLHGHEFALDNTVAAASSVAALLGIGVGLAYWWGPRRACRARSRLGPGPARAAGQPLLHRRALPGDHRPRRAGAGHPRRLVRPRVVNQTGVDGGAQSIGYLGLRLKFLQTGRIPNYALAMAVGVVTITLVAFSRN